MTEGIRRTSGSTSKHKDFVAIDKHRARICVSGYEDGFVATRIDGTWQAGYPEFDDLMDYYSELNDERKALKYSLESRITLNALPENQDSFLIIRILKTRIRLMIAGSIKYVERIFKSD